MKVLSSEKVRSAEEISVKQGLSWLRLMENAGAAASRVIKSKFNVTGLKITVVCGKGNNGGDGYVVARKMKENGCIVKVIQVGGSPSTPSSVEMASRAADLGLIAVNFELDNHLSSDIIMNSDVIVDAIFGTGFKGSPGEPYLSVINEINMSDAKVVSLDLPSGCSSDDGKVCGACVNADLTVTFVALKPCHVLFPAAIKCGNVVSASIGMPSVAVESQQEIMNTIEKSDVKSLLPKREKTFHKGDCGTACFVCGSYGMAGAAVIAAKAAIHSGVGLAKLIIPDSIYNIVGSSVLEAVCCPLSQTADGTLSMSELPKIISEVNKSCSAVIGCGVGTGYDVTSIVEGIIKNARVPLILDADGINAIASRIDIIKQYGANVILTPHPGEAARILGCRAADIQTDRLNSVKKIAALSGAVTVLKGANTLIATPDEKISVCLFGNPGMATAGSGDMLSGIMAALLASGLSAQKSAVCGVSIHALAGDFAAKEKSQTAMTPLDMIDALAPLF
ncbi:MAG: NAD(P)H-hydrate dehydratase, partial [Oscillospiraceae bacterium]|nr:NAD(P)H-hydrate dehydratase [Oscillospiraceae bacterium]